uniref:Uncharacterized protein LOC114340957 n=1 Tax=Diabrotica virgifera virgifera TaxID=50390 RepID=A0A6P7GDL0_DIAVI
MAESRDKELVRSRGTIKGQLTNFETFVNKCKQDKNLLIELESRLDRALGLLDKFEEVQSEIDLMASDEQFVKNLSDERNNFENSFYRVISLAKNMLQESESHLVGSLVGSQIASSSSNHSNNGELALQAKPKLPSIPLPNFSGAVDMWMEYKETYESLVHNNNALSSIEKFHFLKRTLQGDPEKMVKMRKMTAENYEVVWKLLCDRYDDKPLLVGFHIDSLVEFRSLSKESATDLRDMLDTVIESLFALEKLDVESNSWDPFLVHLMSKKFNQFSFSKWEEIRPKKEIATLELFKDFLRNRIDSLKNIERMRKEKNPSDNKGKNGQANWKNKSNKTLVAVETDSCCFYCKEKHFIYNCSSFLKLNTYGRYKQAQKLGLCLNCLQKTNHISKNCQSGTCRKCGRKHNTLLHYGSGGQKMKAR